MDWRFQDEPGALAAEAGSTQKVHLGFQSSRRLRSGLVSNDGKAMQRPATAFGGDQRTYES
jgi:hypothetical protein